MESFNILAEREYEHVCEINHIDEEMKLLKKKISNLKDARKELTSSLADVRLSMKIYLEQELGVKTEN